MNKCVTINQHIWTLHLFVQKTLLTGDVFINMFGESQCQLDMTLIICFILEKEPYLIFTETDMEKLIKISVLSP